MTSAKETLSKLNPGSLNIGSDLDRNAGCQDENEAKKNETKFSEFQPDLQSEIKETPKPEEESQFTPSTYTPSGNGEDTSKSSDFSSYDGYRK